MIAYCIGNGPSLTGRDLDLIADNKRPEDATFAANHIQLIYPQTHWRPDFWVTVETPDFYPILEGMNNPCRIYLTTNRAEMVEASRPAFRMREHISYLWMCDHIWKYKKPGRVTSTPDTIRFGEKDHPICLYGGSGIASIQLAILGGYDPVVLLGHDGLYAEGNHHFVEDYYIQHLNHELRTATIVDAHQKLSAAVKANWHTTIINCTAGGILEMYPRMSLEEVVLTPDFTGINC